MPKYVTKVRVLHDGGEYPIGSDIELTDDQAKQLIESGAIEDPDKRSPAQKLADAASYAEMEKRNAQLAAAKRNQWGQALADLESQPVPPEPLPPVIPKRRYRVAKKFSFAGRTYKSGEVVDLTDAEAAEIEPNRIDLEP